MSSTWLEGYSKATSTSTTINISCSMLGAAYGSTRNCTSLFLWHSYRNNVSTDSVHLSADIREIVIVRVLVQWWKSWKRRWRAPCVWRSRGREASCPAPTATWCARPASPTWGARAAPSAGRSTGTRPGVAVSRRGAGWPKGCWRGWRESASELTHTRKNIFFPDLALFLPLMEL